MRLLQNKSLLLFLVVFALLFIGYIYNKTNSQIVQDKVIKLVEHPVIGGSPDNPKISYRYLVVCEKETFIVESNIFKGKFNNSDVFYRLKEGETYTFKVTGIGKSFVSDYRNIIDIVN